MHAGCKTNNEQPGRLVAKGRYRTRVIIRIASFYLIQKGGQPLALPAIR
jgi:hypothetical protein